LEAKYEPAKTTQKEITKAWPKKHRRGPDKVSQRGPMRASQWGDVVLLENLSTPEQQRQIEEHIAATYPEVCRRIDECVQRMCAILRKIHPITYLQRAYWHVISTHLGEGPEESKIEHKHLVARRLLDYGQSLIAAVGAEHGDMVSDKDVGELEKTADELFATLNPPYFIARTAVARKEPDFDEKREEFIVTAQMHYGAVRGHRYLCHEGPHIHDLLTPQSRLIEQVYGIDADMLLMGFERLLESLTKGVTKVFEDLHAFRDKTLSEFAEDPNLFSAIGLTQESIVDPKLQNWAEERDDIGGRLLGSDLFDVLRVTDWPEQLVADLSLKPSEDTEFGKQGTHAAWPTRLSKTRFKPFLAVGGKYFCFDVYGITDNFYRAVQRALLARRPDLTNEWRIAQQDVTENLPFELLGIILKGATVYRRVFYQTATGRTQKRDWAECDGLLIFDRHLFVIEVRSGAYVYTPPELDTEAHFRSLAEILLKPITQANRFIDELEASGKLILCDNEHNPVVTISRSDFDDITACCVTLDQLEYMACHIQDFTHLSSDVSKHPVWCVSIDDLRVYRDVFDNPLMLLDYLSERKRTQSIHSLKMHDELDHLGAYLHHNRYGTRAEKIAKSPNSSISFAAGYRDELDKFFSAKWLGNECKAPTQEMPVRIRQIVDTLAQSKREGRAAAAKAILALGGEAREDLSNAIDTLLARQQELGRPRPLSLFGPIGTTVFCDQKPAFLTNFGDAVEHALAVMSIENAIDWALFHLTFSEHGLLEDVRWRFLNATDLAAMNPETLAARKARLIETRKDKTTTSMPGTGTKLKL
jgi:hypothetical protein